MEITYEGFLIDLDGTMYRGGEPIPEAVAFIKRLERAALPYLFVTNNSTKRPEQVAAFLTKIGVPATTAHVYTSSMAMTDYLLSQNKKPSAFVIGEDGLHTALAEGGITQTVESTPDFVVIGLDRKVTYEKLARATRYILDGATFVTTNRDGALPSDGGLIPGSGALVAAVVAATGVEPVVIGKPERYIVDKGMKRLGTTKEKTLLIGDNYDTDILAGIRADLPTLLVFTGVTSQEKVKEKDIQPTHSVRSLDDWYV